MAKLNGCAKVKLYIKNMVCSRCKMVVQNELLQMGLHVHHVVLGEADIEENLSDIEKENLHQRLQHYGFSLIDDKKSRLIERIKTLIVDMVHHAQSIPKTNLSDYLSSELNHDYTYLSNLFSEVENTTIEQYFIAQKIEKVKELLVYDELSLSEIADQLQYSSVSHLSKQFKKVTGFTASYFRNLKEQKRNSIADL